MARMATYREENILGESKSALVISRMFFIRYFTVLWWMSISAAQADRSPLLRR